MNKIRISHTETHKLLMQLKKYCLKCRRGGNGHAPSTLMIHTHYIIQQILSQSQLTSHHSFFPVFALHAPTIPPDHHRRYARLPCECPQLLLFCCNQFFQSILHRRSIPKLRCVIQKIHIYAIFSDNICFLIFPFFCTINVHIDTNRRHSMHMGRINGIVKFHSFLYRFNALMELSHSVKCSIFCNRKCDMDCLWFNLLIWLLIF